MTLRPALSVDDPPANQAWQEIETVLDELAELARSDIGPTELHSRVLERLVGLLSAVGGVIWSFAEEGRPNAECQLHLDQSLAGDAHELARHQRLALAIAAAGQPRMVPPAFRDGQLANASPWLAILVPITVSGQPLLVVEIFQRADGRTAVEEGYLRLVRTVCEIVEEYHRTRALANSRAGQEELRGLLEYVAAIHQHLDLARVAAAIANEARRVLECDRVTVLSWQGRWPKVESISGVESFDRRSGMVQTLIPLAKSVLNVGQPLWLPGEADELPQQQSDQVHAFLDESHARAAGFIPLFADASEEAEPVGLLCLERFGAEFDKPARQRSESIATATAAALTNALEYDAIPARGLLQWIAGLLGLGHARRSPALVAAGIAAVIIVAFVLIPAELTMEARGRLMPQRRQHAFAPSDGTVIDLPLKDGAKVAQGDLLARLHSPQLDIASSELIGKQRTLEENLASAETESLRSETEGNSNQPRSQILARTLQLKEEIRGLEAQLQVVRQQQAQLEVKSPLDGVVVAWDAERQLAGRPVKRGDSLLTVADLAGPWELILDVPDRRAGHVLAARRGQTTVPVTFQLGTDPGVVRRGTVTTISPATELSPQTEPIVHVTASLTDAPPAQLRPGATVVARIHCGRRSLGYVWLHELWEAIRLRLFL